MKKILYLSQMYPYPPDGGGKIKTLNTLKALAQEYEIFAVFVSETNPKKKELEALTKLNIQVKVFYGARILDSVKDDLLNLFWHFMRGIPHYVFQYTDKIAASYIQKLVKEFKPDIIHIDHLNISQYLPKTKKQVWILEHHNVESYLYWTRFLHSLKFTRKAYLFIELILTFLYERNKLKRFDHIFAISSVETDRVKKLFDIKNVSTQPFIYKTTKLKKIYSTKPYILFIGNLGWPPNDDAIIWFLNDIWPLILKELPSSELHIVGKRQPLYEKKWPEAKNIVLHGYQKSLQPYLSRAHAFIMPFRMGGGMRIKSLTTLAAGVPLVATPLAIEGINVKNKQECVIAKNSAEFSQALLAVVRSKSLQRKLSQQAISYVKKSHNPDLNQKFLRTYAQVTQKSE